MADLSKKAELRAVAQRMFDRGFTVIGSVEKAAKLHPWKAASPLQCFTYACHNIANGKANSLSLRLDGNLAALDCDLTAPGAMEETLRQFKASMGGAPLYTCKGKKGGKIFFRLNGKKEACSTKILASGLYPADTDWNDIEAKESAKNDFELKLDLSAFYGRHSEGVEYGAVPGTLQISECPSPEALPLFNESDIKAIVELVQRNQCLVPWSGLPVARRELMAGEYIADLIINGDTDLERMIAMHGLYTDEIAESIDFKDLEDFCMEYCKYFELEVLGALQGERPGMYCGQARQAIQNALQTPNVRRDQAFACLDQLYGTEKEQLLRSIIQNEGTQAEDLFSSWNFLQLYAYTRDQRFVWEAQARLFEQGGQDAAL